MSARYKIVHFVPDQVSGARYPIGAVIETDDDLEVVKADLIPGAGCLGSRSKHMVLREVLDDLREVTSFGRLPRHFGHHFQFSESKAIPGEVGDPSSWVKEFVLPKREEDSPADARKRAKSRKTFGRDYLANQGLYKWVEPNFKPSRSTRRLNGKSTFLPSVSHGVESDNQITLLEPLVATREQWADDVADVGRKFLVYQKLDEDRGFSSDLESIAYLLPHGPNDVRDEMRKEISEVTDQVVDTSNRKNRDWFVSHVEQVGKMAEAEDETDGGRPTV